MAKTKKLSTISEKNMSPVDHHLTRMKYKDIKRACIARGMPFDHIALGSVLQCSSWLSQNYDMGQNLVLLDEYDAWFEAQMIEQGYKKGDAILHNNLKLGFIANADEDGNVGKKKPRLANKGLDKKKKPVRERIEGTKIFKGTKKAMTYQLQAEGKSFKETLPLVIAQFPEAKEKSVKIWHRRAELAQQKLGKNK